MCFARLLNPWSNSPLTTHVLLFFSRLSSYHSHMSFSDVAGVSITPSISSSPGVFSSSDSSPSQPPFLHCIGGKTTSLNGRPGPRAQFTHGLTGSDSLLPADVSPPSFCSILPSLNSILSNQRTATLLSAGPRNLDAVRISLTTSTTLEPTAPMHNSNVTNAIMQMICSSVGYGGLQ